MPRPLWNGAIAFGMVTIPVRLFPAVSRKSVSFNQIDRETGSRIKYKKVSALDEREVTKDDIVKGYELPSGEYVLIDDDELSALDPKAARTIDIEEFVDLADIDPIFFDTAYYLTPDRATAKPYKLLAEALEAKGKVGIARFVMRSKQHLGAIRSQDGRLLLSTMVYADEVNDPAELEALAELDDVEVSAKEVAMAESLIDSLAATFEPERFRDTHREQVLELIERKAAGAAPLAEPDATDDDDKVIDLMAALEASVKAAKEARKRHPTTGVDIESRSDDDAEADADEADEAEGKTAKPKAKATTRKRKTA